MRHLLVGLFFGTLVSAAALGGLSYFVPQKVTLAADPLVQQAPTPAPNSAPKPSAPAVPQVPPAPPTQAPTPAPVPPPDPAPASPKATPVAPAAQIATNLPPLQAYAAPFDAGQVMGAPAKALFAIVLIDTGHPKLDRVMAANLPFPVAFAIDPEAPFAAEAMALYRAAGKEVIVMPRSFPTSGEKADIDSALRNYARLLPESVAMLSAPVGGFQDERGLASLVVPAIGAQGRGVLLIDRGLNTAAQIARREGVAYALVSKILDSTAEPVPVMRQYLDRAVFKAALNGAAVVMGNAQPDTLAAVGAWSLEGRAGEVSIAPISALMQPPRP